MAPGPRKEMIAQVIGYQMETKLVFIGKVKWRYRLRHIFFAAKCFYLAILGYHVSIETTE